MLTRPHQIFFADKLTGFVECISTHADDCVVTMQVDGNEILLWNRNICCKMHASGLLSVGAKNRNFMRPVGLRSFGCVALFLW